MITGIVTYINEQLQATALADIRFNGSGIYPVATPQVRDSKEAGVVPMYVQDGNIKPIMPNDKMPLQLWHTNNGITYRESPGTSFGDKLDFIRTMQMTLVVLADVRRIKIAAEDMELLLVEAIPATLTTALLQQLKIRSCNITHTGSSFRSADIYNREFKAQSSALKPNHIMFEVRYTIEALYTKGCLTINCFC